MGYMLSMTTQQQNSNKTNDVLISSRRQAITLTNVHKRISDEFNDCLM